MNDNTTPDHPAPEWEPTVLQAFAAFMSDHFDDQSLIDAPDWLVIVQWFESIGLDMTIGELRDALAIAERADAENLPPEVNSAWITLSGSDTEGTTDDWAAAAPVLAAVASCVLG